MPILGTLAALGRAKPPRWQIHCKELVWQHFCSNAGREEQRGMFCRNHNKSVMCSQQPGGDSVLRPGNRGANADMPAGSAQLTPGFCPLRNYKPPSERQTSTLSSLSIRPVHVVNVFIHGSLFALADPSSSSANHTCKHLFT